MTQELENKVGKKSGFQSIVGNQPVIPYSGKLSVEFGNIFLEMLRP